MEPAEEQEQGRCRLRVPQTPPDSWEYKRSTDTISTRLCCRLPPLGTGQRLAQFPGGY